jgi:hypothetical protein
MSGRLDMAEIGLTLVADHASPVRPEIRDLIDHARVRSLDLVEAAARRALGVAESDPDELGRALDLFRAIGAEPAIERVNAERALLLGDEAGYEAATASLERLGDVAQVERLAERRAKARVRR